MAEVVAAGRVYPPPYQRCTAYLKWGVAGRKITCDHFSDERVVRAGLRPERSSGNSANPHHDYCFNRLFSKTGCFTGKLTGAFSGLPLGAKNGTMNCLTLPCADERKRIAGRKFLGFPGRKNRIIFLGIMREICSLRPSVSIPGA
jgi:hypothetical protein